MKKLKYILLISICLLLNHTIFAQTPVEQQKIYARPQWGNMGIGVGGLYFSAFNIHVRSFFKPLDKYGQSKGLYLGLYWTAQSLETENLGTEAGIRSMYFLRPIETKFNFYAKAELRIINLVEETADEGMVHIAPRIGAGMKWRFLYVEGGLGPIPVHVGLCWHLESIFIKKKRR